MSACSHKVPGKPCPSCPWRQDQDAADIPNFDIERAERLASTCPDERGFGPSFGAAMFACHQSHDGKEIACAGWLATVGACHPNVRFAVMAGKLSEKALEPGPDWPELHDNYQDVLKKLRDTA